MEFDEKLALEIIEKHNLKPKALAVWKTRGRIPDRYADENYEKRLPASKIDKVKSDRLIEIFDSGKLNVKAFAEMAEVPYFKVQDARLKKYALSKQDILKLTNAMNRLRIDIKKEVEKLANKAYFSDSDDKIIKQLLSRPELTYKVIADNVDRETRMVLDYNMNKQSIPDTLKKQVLDRFTVFVLETRIN